MYQINTTKKVYYILELLYAITMEYIPYGLEQ